MLAAAATPPQSCDLDLVCVDDDVDELPDDAYALCCKTVLFTAAFHEMT